MPKERDLRMEKYSISGNRYRELKYFCRQYREKQELERFWVEEKGMCCFFLEADAEKKEGEENEPDKGGTGEAAPL